jgi:hypothetical protein
MSPTASSTSLIAIAPSLVPACEPSNTTEAIVNVDAPESVDNDKISIELVITAASVIAPVATLRTVLAVRIVNFFAAVSKLCAVAVASSSVKPLPTSEALTSVVNALPMAIAPTEKIEK